ncbi:hypothetical protein [Halomarina ordinaria]|uniref:Uncharacterized protein n=1 Tax=Halomarina ordinaria TaxID=3033939 RepID=A0ABD5U3Z2_9EURY|nr:hypothetical protein [Halomarina sp. PSRA2]
MTRGRPAEEGAGEGASGASPTDPEPDEPRVGWFTQWLRRRPNSFEFWEVLVTDERLVWCFAGESFRSMLLRADMGEATRAFLEDATPEAALAHSERGFSVPLASLRTLRLRQGTRTRRARLVVEWEASGERVAWELSNTADGDEQADLLERLANRESFSHVDCEVETPRFAFL